ncbi:hypothetical protein SALB1_2284 [Salinisphaera sp. LB1]|nr:hypothetical protein SALB1_2284 [Salinisphaera sp. LB1]
MEQAPSVSCDRVRKAARTVGAGAFRRRPRVGHKKGRDSRP